MFCDKCGSPFAAGAQYCRSCGKQILGANAAPGAAAPGRPAGQPGLTAGDGRVGRNLNLLAGLWLASGILRFMLFGSLTLFRSLVFNGDSGWFRPAGWPFGFDPFVLGGAGLAFLAVAYLVLAWALYDRLPWARVFGIVIACLALLRFPFGTALGIYTLWVLLPEASRREYDALAEARSPGAGR